MPHIRRRKTCGIGGSSVMEGDRRVVGVLKRIRRVICRVNDRALERCVCVLPGCGLGGSSRSVLFLRLFWGSGLAGLRVWVSSFKLVCTCLHSFHLTEQLVLLHFFSVICLWFRGIAQEATLRSYAGCLPRNVILISKRDGLDANNHVTL